MDGNASGEDERSIADELSTCSKSFRSLLAQPNSTKPELTSQVPYKQWKEEFGRLRTWSANIGAHQRGNTSLDFRLRDASHIQNRVAELLTELNELLSDTLTFLEDAKTVDDGESNHSDQEDESEYEELHSSVVLRIDCLFDLSLVIRKPAKVDRLAAFNKARGIAFSEFDLSHVEHKLPYAPQELQKGLASAVTLRRSVLKYYESHQGKYARGIKKVFDDENAISEAPPTEFSVNAATEFYPDDDTRSTSGDSNQSMKSIMESGRRLHIPIPAEVHDGKPYSCPYCHYLLDIYDPRKYARHVFEDITPYQCIFENCPHKLDLLASKSAWLRHVTESHHTEWQALSSANRCFMCGDSDYTAKGVAKHVARHLEDLAMFVLPVPDNDEDYTSDEELAPSQIANLQDISDSEEEPPAHHEPNVVTPLHATMTMEESDESESSFRGTIATLAMEHDERTAYIPKITEDGENPIESFKVTLSDEEMWEEMWEPNERTLAANIEASRKARPVGSKIRGVDSKRMASHGLDLERMNVGEIDPTDMSPAGQRDTQTLATLESHDLTAHGSSNFNNDAHDVATGGSLTPRDFSKPPRTQPFSEDGTLERATSDNGAEGRSDDGLTSPAENNPGRDKLKMTREEREAQYKILRDRIFADFQKSLRIDNLKDDNEDPIPEGARWTKISRALVNPQALEEAHERFEERDDYIFVLRVLTRAEIDELAESTRLIREQRELEWAKHDNRSTHTPQGALTEEDGGAGAEVYRRVNIADNVERTSCTRRDEPPSLRQPNELAVEYTGPREQFMRDSAGDSRNPFRIRRSKSQSMINFVEKDLKESAELNAVMSDYSQRDLPMGSIVEKRYTRKGRTRMPKRLVHIQALKDFGHSYHEEDEKTLIIESALGPENIDEVFVRSKEYFGAEVTGRVDSGIRSASGKSSGTAEGKVLENEATRARREVKAATEREDLPQVNAEQESKVEEEQPGLSINSKEHEAFEDLNSIESIGRRTLAGEKGQKMNETAKGEQRAEAVQESIPAEAIPERPMPQIEGIREEFRAQLRPKVQEFLADLPPNETDRQKVSRYLSESLLQLIIRLDSIDVGGMTTARMTRKKLVGEISSLFEAIDNVSSKNAKVIIERAPF